jgi:hypothetical protein
MRQPVPKARLVTRRPGAACRLLCVHIHFSLNPSNRLGFKPALCNILGTQLFLDIHFQDLVQDFAANNGKSAI